MVLKSAQLLFDLFKRERILFNDAANSFLVTTDASRKILNRWLLYGSFTDEHKILLNMLKGTLEESLEEDVLDLLDDFEKNCVILKDYERTADPDPCIQGIAYSSSKFICI